jgi:hypothetical protein
MSSLASILRDRERALQGEIDASMESFDIGAPLTAKELEYAGMLGVLPAVQPKQVSSVTEMPLLREIEDVEDPETDAVAALADRNDYNVQYVRYMRCQALAALAAFTEGWSALEEMALKDFVRNVKRENDEYRGTDPNKSFSLRIRQQTAEDFLRFIRQVVNEAIMTPKPALATK